MSPRPRITADLLASVTLSIPPRLQKKLDENPRMAESWGWGEEGEQLSVTTDKGEKVLLSPREGALGEISQIRCTCLLSPRCLHLLAVVTALEIHAPQDPSPTGASADDSQPQETTSPEHAILTKAQLRAADQSLRTMASLLSLGASAAGVAISAEILRSVHSCRSEGLHRLAAAGLRVHQDLRSLHADAPEFTLSSLSSDLAEMGLVATMILSSEQEGASVDPSWIGRARREYTALGNTRLQGLFAEPIISSTGYAGLLLYFLDRKGRILVVPDIRPGEGPRAIAAYEAPPALGGVTVPSRQLCREGLLIQDATASRDGRLGAGAGVRAVSSGASTWADCASLWEPDLQTQIDSVFSWEKSPEDERSAGGDLLFLHLRVVGASERALWVREGRTGDGALLACLAPAHHRQLRYEENLRQLARAPGLLLRVIGRVCLDEPKTLHLLSVGPADDPLPESEGPRLLLPPEWRGRVNLGFDPLSGGSLSGARGHPVLLPETLRRTYKDPLAPLTRRTERMALGGRMTLPASTMQELHRERFSLEQKTMRTAARLLDELADAALGAERDLTGRRRGGDPLRLARAWLRSVTYLHAAQREIERQRWR